MHSIIGHKASNLAVSNGHSPRLPFARAGRPRRQVTSFATGSDARLQLNKHTWDWKGYGINYVVAGCGKPIVLIHGFGASSGHWRSNIPVLAESYKVYAIDLLGFGASEKAVREYTIELWRDMVLDFTAEFVDQPYVLVGNSMGSLISLAVNAASEPGRVTGTVLLNCAGGMNSTARSDDWRLQLAAPLFWAVERLLKTEAIAVPLFDKFRQPESIRNVLKSVYCNKDAVDDELLDIICKPSDDAGALSVFTAVITGPPGPQPEDLMPSVDNPVLVIWGDRDTLTPLDGPVGEYFKGLPISKANVTMTILTEVGHCPQDDKPELVHEQMLPWLASL